MSHLFTHTHTLLYIYPPTSIYPCLIDIIFTSSADRKLITSQGCLACSAHEKPHFSGMSHLFTHTHTLLYMPSYHNIPIDIIFTSSADKNFSVLLNS